MTGQSAVVDSASFRDSAGFVFSRDGIVFRQINHAYRPTWDALVSSGCLTALQNAGLFLPHEQVAEAPAIASTASLVIKPRQLDLISYPYEWSPGQLRDAALLTIEVMQLALGHGFSLKDASAYNVQLVDGRPVFIDTLSLEPYHDGEPWVAYRQFCQHFLAPLALMCRRDVRLGMLLRQHIDGIPLDLCSRLLPLRTWLSPSLALHLHAHGRMNQSEARPVGSTGRPLLAKRNLLNLLEHLRAVVESLAWKPTKTEWRNYYQSMHNYSDAAMHAKESLVRDMLAQSRPKTVWDLGANTGRFSDIAVAQGATVAAWDIDPACVELAYQRVRKERIQRLHPLLQDLANPSPAIGWANNERKSLAQRGPADVVMALGLIHHLAIGNNVPLATIAEFCAGIGREVIIEMVPKEDSQVQRLLATRRDVFPEFDLNGLLTAFSSRFHLLAKNHISGTHRTLLHFKKLS